ncbi:MAG TPA: hypothetical protein VF173_28300 [Thermoanaerobaculia bacterium]|nr:hypothetical protein [Thermoanaerobaculia bacterium]
MKIRSRGPWPLSDIIHEVLPDLYKAFAERRSHRLVRQARFVSDARRGQWREIEEFFQQLEPCELGPDPPYMRLDDSIQLKVRAPKIKAEMVKVGLGFTRQGLFRYISRVATKFESLSADPGPQEQAWVWELLRAFRFEQAGVDELRQAVLARIRGRVLEAEETVLKRLLGDFLEKGKENAAFLASDLLADHGLADVNLKDREVLVERGRRLLGRVLAHRRYHAGHDVRVARSVAFSELDPAKMKPLIFLGESGKGKSWALCARAQGLAEQGRLVLLVDAAADRTSTSEAAAAAFCREIWGHDSHIPLERLHERLKTTDPAHAEAWLELLVDGVQSLDLAEQLAAYDWNAYGIRLSFSLTISGTELSESLLALSQREEVTDFSTRELHDYLQRRLGDSALQVSYSEDSILHQPLLARIFCDLAGDEAAPIPPASDFQLMAHYWAGFSNIKPLAVAAIAELAAQAPDGRAYPWTMRTLRESGIDEAAILLLTDKGLLRRSPDGRSTSLWHDRLLNWAASEGWVALIRDGRLTPEGLGERLKELREPSLPEARWGRRWMGDAILDVLWILLEPGWGLEEVVEQVLPGLALRSEALETLGDRVTSVLIKLVREQPTSSYYEIQALKGIQSSEVAERACELLGDDEMESRLAAARILVGQPTPDALDSLWRLRCELERKEPQDLNAIHGIVNKALAACAKNADQWVRHAIRRAEPEEPVHDLVYLLPQMEQGRLLWFELKGIIFPKVSEKGERCIAICLEDFRDTSHLDWLKARVQRDSPLGGAARRALFFLEPGRQPDPIDGEATMLGVARGWWLLPHVNADPAVAESFIAQTVERAEDPWHVAWTLLSGFENRISPETLDRLLDATSERLAKEIAEPAGDKKAPLWAPFLFLADVRSMRLIERFEARRGSDLERNLAQWLCARGPTNDRYHRHQEEKAVRILERISGEKIRQVGHCWLSRGRTFWALLEAIDLAVLQPDEQTSELLFEVAMREEVEGSDHPIAQVSAIGALLAIGRTDLAVRGAMKWALKLSWDSIDLFAEYCLTATDLRPALDAVEGTDDPDPNVVLTIGLGGGDQDVPTIHKILASAPKGSELARACLLSLYATGDRSEETTRAFLDNLASTATEYISTLGLLRIRTPQALFELKARMRGLDRDRLSSGDNAVLIAVNLLQDQSTRREVAETLWNELDRDRILFVVQGNLLPFVELDRLDVDDWLYDLALGEGHRHLDFSTQTSAIRAVAIRDKACAFDAALRLTELEASNLEEVPGLLLEIDPGRALPWLHRRLEQEDEVIMMSAIAENLYAADQGNALLDWLKDPSPRVRESGCIVAEFSPWDDDLERCLRTLLYDSNWYVRNAANQALDRLWQTREVDYIVDVVLGEPDATRRLCLLDIALEAGHPGLWQRQPWVARLWAHLPLAMRQRAAERLKKRRKEVRDELKKRKRRDT